MEHLSYCHGVQKREENCDWKCGITDIHLCDCHMQWLLLVVVFPIGRPLRVVEKWVVRRISRRISRRVVRRFPRRVVRRSSRRCSRRSSRRSPRRVVRRATVSLWEFIDINCQQPWVPESSSTINCCQLSRLGRRVVNNNC